MRAPRAGVPYNPPTRGQPTRFAAPGSYRPPGGTPYRPVGRQPAMSGPRSTRAQAAHAAHHEGADADYDPDDAHQHYIDTLVANEANLVAQFTTAQPEERAMILQAITHSEQLRQSMQTPVPEHTEDAEAVLAAFEQRSRRVMEPWVPPGGGGPPIDTYDVSYEDYDRAMPDAGCTTTMSSHEDAHDAALAAMRERVAAADPTFDELLSMPAADMAGTNDEPLTGEDSDDSNDHRSIADNASIVAQSDVLTWLQSGRDAVPNNPPPQVDDHLLREAFNPPTRRDHDYLTAWHARQRYDVRNASYAELNRRLDYVDVLSAQARLERDGRYGVRGDTPVGRDLAQDVVDETTAYEQSSDAQMSHMHRRRQCDSIAPMLSIGTASPAMLGVHAAELTTRRDLAINELRSIRGCEARLAEYLLGSTANALGRAKNDVEAELIRSMKSVPQPVDPTLVAARVRLWRWYQVVLESQRVSASSLLADRHVASSTYPDGTAERDAYHLAGGQPMLDALDAARPILDADTDLTGPWHALVNIADTEYAGLRCGHGFAPMHCVVTAANARIGETFLQCPNLNFENRCNFFVWTNRPLNGQTRTVPDDFDGTSDRGYTEMLEPLAGGGQAYVPSDAARRGHRLRVAAALTAGVALFGADSNIVRPTSGLPRARKIGVLNTDSSTHNGSRTRTTATLHSCHESPSASPVPTHPTYQHQCYTRLATPESVPPASTQTRLA